jgi:hypothetical protein
MLFGNAQCTLIDAKKKRQGIDGLKETPASSF